MLKFCHRTLPGIIQLKGLAPVPPIRVTRRLARLSRNQLAAVIGCSAESIRKWECDRQNRTADRIAWLLFLCYIVPDPEFGWLRAALGLSPHGKIPPGVAQIVAQPPGKWTQVAGYKRRHRNRKLSKP